MNIAVRHSLVLLPRAEPPSIWSLRTRFVLHSSSFVASSHRPRFAHRSPPSSRLQLVVIVIHRSFVLRHLVPSTIDYTTSAVQPSRTFVNFFMALRRPRRYASMSHTLCPAVGILNDNSSSPSNDTLRLHIRLNKRVLRRQPTPQHPLTRSTRYLAHPDHLLPVRFVINLLSFRPYIVRSSLFNLLVRQFQSIWVRHYIFPFNTSSFCTFILLP